MCFWWSGEAERLVQDAADQQSEGWESCCQEETILSLCGHTQRWWRCVYIVISGLVTGGWAGEETAPTLNFWPSEKFLSESCCPKVQNLGLKAHILGEIWTRQNRNFEHSLSLLSEIWNYLSEFCRKFAHFWPAYFFKLTTLLLSWPTGIQSSCCSWYSFCVFFVMCCSMYFHVFFSFWYDYSFLEIVAFGLNTSGISYLLPRESHNLSQLSVSRSRDFAFVYNVLLTFPFHRLF